MVYGHFTTSSFAKAVIYTFHMPLFFFISGFLHKNDPRYWLFFRKKTIHLLVPYVSFTLISSIPLVAHVAHHGAGRAELIRQSLFVVLWGGSAMTGIYGVLWFLTCLFMTQQLANWLLVRFRWRFVAALAVAFLLISYANSMLLPRLSMPLDANVVFAALPFFIAGYYCRNFSLQGWPLAVASAAGAVAIVILVQMGKPIAYDMRATDYGVPFLSPILALCGISACILISKLLVNSPASSALQALGKFSLGIMFLHKLLPAIPGFLGLLRYGDIFYCVLTVVLSYGVTLALNRYNVCRALLLGSQADFVQLTQRRGIAESGMKAT